MSYAINVDPAAQSVIDVLPPTVLDTLVDVFALLELEPWSAPSIAPESNPGGAVRTIEVGQSAMLVYLVLEDEQRVDVLRIIWAG